MSGYQPPFAITPLILNQVIEIGELMGYWAVAIRECRYLQRKKAHPYGPPASQISRLMDELLGWLKTTELHPLIAGAIFHCEFEFIHPFADGNGRMGRLWQTLILSEWRAELAWLPLETLIHFQQERYYQC